MTDQERDRAEFEAWALRHDGWVLTWDTGVPRIACGTHEYDDEVYSAWAAWLAARRSQAEPTINATLNTVEIRGPKGSVLYVRAEQLRELVEAVDVICESSPPDDWEPWDCGEPCGYGERGDKNYVSEVDISNSGDVADHASAVTQWWIAKKIRSAAQLKETP